MLTTCKNSYPLERYFDPNYQRALNIIDQTLKENGFLRKFVEENSIEEDALRNLLFNQDYLPLSSFSFRRKIAMELVESHLIEDSGEAAKTYIEESVKNYVEEITRIIRMPIYRDSCV